MAHPGGRPTDYTPELADKICAELAQGRSLKKTCLTNDWAPNIATIFDWLAKYPEFNDKYVKAKQDSAEAWHEDLADIGDQALELSQSVDPKSSNAVVQALKLKADNIKWMMSKMKPKKYGEKVDLTTNGKDMPTPILASLKKE